MSIFTMLFGCRHKRTTFPRTPRRHLNSGLALGSTRVVCLDCGSEFAYDWEKMRIGGKIVSEAPQRMRPDSQECAVFLREESQA